MEASNKGEDIGPPGSNEVLIGSNVMIMPLEKILLIRKDLGYCAIKFTRFWNGKTEEDRYARYESYYPNNKAGNFSNQNVEFKEKQLYSPKPSWSLFGHPFAFGAKEEIRCGPITLWWTGNGTVYFFKRYQPQGDYGIELAPTKWTNISQVNVFDPRVKWYRYDAKRKDIKIPIDRLWDDKEGGR